MRSPTGPSPKGWSRGWASRSGGGSWKPNRERPQPDGEALLQPEHIHPGWRPLLPADAAPPPGARPVVPTAAGPETMTDQTPTGLLAEGEPIVDLGRGRGAHQAGRR